MVSKLGPDEIDFNFNITEAVVPEFDDLIIRHKNTKIVEAIDVDFGNLPGDTNTSPKRSAPNSTSNHKNPRFKRSSSSDKPFHHHHNAVRMRQLLLVTHDDGPGYDSHTHTHITVIVLPLH